MAREERPTLASGRNYSTFGIGKDVAVEVLVKGYEEIQVLEFRIRAGSHARLVSTTINLQGQKGVYRSLSFPVT